MPPNGSYVWIDFVDYWDVIDGIDVLKYTKCQNLLTTFLPPTTIMEDYECEGCSDSFSDCVFIGENVQWGSVKAGASYSGPGLSRPDG